MRQGSNSPFVIDLVNAELSSCQLFRTRIPLIDIVEIDCTPAATAAATLVWKQVTDNFRGSNFELAGMNSPLNSTKCASLRRRIRGHNQFNRRRVINYSGPGYRLLLALISGEVAAHVNACGVRTYSIFRARNKQTSLCISFSTTA